MSSKANDFYFDTYAENLKHINFTMLNISNFNQLDTLENMFYTQMLDNNTKLY